MIHPCRKLRVLRKSFDRACDTHVNINTRYILESCVQRDACDIGEQSSPTTNISLLYTVRLSSSTIIVAQGRTQDAYVSIIVLYE